MTWIIGITGGIGSGKTTVCQVFKSIGIPVYDADTRAKHLMNYSKTLKISIKEILGKEAYYRNGRLNRPLVAEKIFNDKKLLRAINGVVHPAVHQDATEWLKSQDDAPYVLYEAALLVENGSYRSFDKLIVVSAPEELRIARVVKRDKTKEEQVRARIRNQLPEVEKIAVADYVINNDETQSVVVSVIKVHRKIISEIKENVSKTN